MIKNIPVERNIVTSVLIENKYHYNVEIDMDLAKGKDFEIKMTFKKVNMSDIKILNDLFLKPAAISISCPFFKDNDYKIDQLVVERITIPGNGTLIWDCLSDEPFNLLIQ